MEPVSTAVNQYSDENNTKPPISLTNASNLSYPIRTKVVQGQHHYRYTIDLRTIRNLNITFQCNCFLRYTYTYGHGML